MVGVGWALPPIFSAGDQVVAGARLRGRIPDCDKSAESLIFGQRRPIGYTCVMTRVISVYLTATILACPLFCGFAECGAPADGSQRIGCCSCCHGCAPQSSENHPTAPERDSSDPAGSCQCICGGAVVDDAGSVVAPLDTSWWSPVAIILPHSIRADSLELEGFCAAPWPDIGMNLGRELCCLYSRFLC